jgi:hypothetical protein
MSFSGTVTSVGPANRYLVSDLSSAACDAQNWNIHYSFTDSTNTVRFGRVVVGNGAGADVALWTDARSTVSVTALTGDTVLLPCPPVVSIGAGFGTFPGQVGPAPQGSAPTA